ncbi:MAG: hypothetical protein FJX11_20185 [Alphaproteobacteria bacterium]|nr:hypothetical protein [Alphaproteobacteria bacterium]
MHFRNRLLVLVGAGTLTGVSGAFYAHYVSSVSPKILGLDTFLLVFGMMIIGGIGRFPGVVWSAPLVTAANELLRDTGYLRLIGFGCLIIFAVLFLREGLAGTIHRAWIRGPWSRRCGARRPPGSQFDHPHDQGEAPS